MQSESSTILDTKANVSDDLMLIFDSSLTWSSEGTMETHIRSVNRVETVWGVAGVENSSTCCGCFSCGEVDDLSHFAS